MILLPVIVSKCGEHLFNLSVSPSPSALWPKEGQADEKEEKVKEKKEQLK